MLVTEAKTKTITKTKKNIQSEISLVTKIKVTTGAVTFSRSLKGQDQMSQKFNHSAVHRNPYSYNKVTPISDQQIFNFCATNRHTHTHRHRQIHGCYQKRVAVAWLVY